MESLWLLLSLVVLGTPVVALVAFLRTYAQERALRELRAQLDAQARQIASLRAGIAPPPAPQAAAPEAAAAAAPLPPVPPRVVPAAPPPVEAAAPRADRAPPPRENLESALTSRWLVWLGALAIGLAGVFLVKYAIDNQLLTPAARVALGLLLGIVLAVSGEVLRRKPLARAIAAVRPNHVPPALTASGLFVAFASVYAAYSLYDLVAPLAGFLGLAAIALLAVGLSLLQGRFVALTGLLGAFATPALVVTPHPSAFGLFAYLLVVEVACLAVARYQRWWWFALSALAGVALWPLLWLADNGTAADAWPVGLYLLFSAAAYIVFCTGRGQGAGEEGWFAELRHLPMPERTAAIAAAVLGVLFLVLADAAGYNNVSLSLSALAFLLYLFAGRRDGYADILAVIAAVVAIAIVAAMPAPGAIAMPERFVHAPLVPVELTGFAGTASLFAALFAVAGFVALWGARRPAVWAGVSASTPVAMLAIGYWRILAFGVDFAWAAIAVGIAALALFAAERVERYRAARGLDISLGFYAAAVVAAISLAAAMSLREAWLSVALALQLPALGWISRHVSARAIRIIAGIVVAVVVVRLAFNYNILAYRAAGAFSWIVYGYGIPAIACLLAAREFARGGRDVLVTALEAAGLAFAVLLLSLEIRLLVTGSLGALRYPLLEQALQSIAWLSLGTVLTLRDTRTPNPVSRYGGRILLALAVAQVVFLQLLAANPAVTGEAVGTHPLINVLGFAYLVPALFAFALALGLPDRAGMWPGWRAGAALLGIVLVFADVSLEVRRAFRGPVLTAPSHGDAELYAYSAAWLVFAGVLLSLGIRARRPLVRHAGLGVLMLVALKVFLVDMGGLTGLYRVASFLGLGLSLVGIGWLYQRFVTTAARPG